MSKYVESYGLWCQSNDELEFNLSQWFSFRIGDIIVNTDKQDFFCVVYVTETYVEVKPVNNVRIHFDKESIIINQNILKSENWKKW